MNEKPAILHTAVLFTTDMEGLAEFYRHGLQLGEAQRTGSDHIGFQLPNAYLGFDQVAEPLAAGGGVTLWFEVTDLQAAFERFVTLGAQIRYKPSRKPWGAYLASLLDPDGNIFGLSQSEQE